MKIKTTQWSSTNSTVTYNGTNAKFHKKICIFSKQIKSPNAISHQNKIQTKLKSINSDRKWNMNSDCDFKDIVPTNFEHRGLNMLVLDVMRRRGDMCGDARDWCWGLGWVVVR